MSQILDNPISALSEYVSHPSVSADSKFSEGIRGAREFATKRLEELGFSVPKPIKKKKMMYVLHLGYSQLIDTLKYVINYSRAKSK